MRRTRKHLEASVPCARNEWDNTELTTKTSTPRARSRVHVVLRVDSGSWFSCCHWCRTPQRPARWFHSSAAFHHANTTPSAKFFFLDVVVRLCPVIVHSICIPNSCIFHRENGSFEVLSLQCFAASPTMQPFTWMRPSPNVRTSSCLLPVFTCRPRN